MLLQRKNDRRDASCDVRDAVGGAGAMPGGSGSMRKRNCGLTRTALRAISIPASKSASLAGLAVKLHRPRQVGAVDRPTVGPANERGENAPGTRFLFARILGFADEDSPPAGRVAMPSGAKGPVIET